MGCEFFSGLQTFNNDVENDIQYYGGWSRDRIFRTTDPFGLGVMKLNTKTASDGTATAVQEINFVVSDGSYPLDGVVTSPPIFMNSISFPNDNPGNWFNVAEQGGNSMIEFRTADTPEGLNDAEWKSVSIDGDPGYNDAFFNFGGMWAGPIATSDTISATLFQSGIKIVANNPNSAGEVGYYAREGLVSGVTAINEVQATYLTADIESTKKGAVGELVVIHGLTYPLEDDIKKQDAPFKYKIVSDKINNKQTISWDITDWPSGERNLDYIRAFGVKIIDPAESIVLKVSNVKLTGLNDPNVSAPTSSQFPAGPGKFIQYRVTISETEKSATEPEPVISGVQMQFNYRKTIMPNYRMRGGKCVSSDGVQFPRRVGMVFDHLNSKSI